MPANRRMQSRATQITVGTTSVIISPKKIDGSRLAITLRNSSTGGQIISLFLSETDAAVSLSGIVLASGQGFAMSEDSGSLCWRRDIYAFADASGGTL